MIDDYHCDVLMPHIRVLHEAEPQSQKALIDFQQSLGDSLHGEVLFELFLVHRVLFLLDHGAVISHIPKVQFPIEFPVILRALGGLERQQLFFLAIGQIQC